MLELIVEGDTHPKTFKIKTDDAEAELARLEDIFKEVDAEDWQEWLTDHTADQFAEGVEFPSGEVGELAELLEGVWPQVEEKVAAERADYERTIQEEGKSV